MAITLAVTHFNNTTLLENERWREINNYSGCIYNSPVAIKETIMLFSKIYVIEMNNETKKYIRIRIIIDTPIMERKELMFYILMKKYYAN